MAVTVAEATLGFLFPKDFSQNFQGLRRPAHPFMSLTNLTLSIPGIGEAR